MKTLKNKLKSVRQWLIAFVGGSGRLRNRITKPKSTESEIKSALKKEMAMSDEEYKDFCKKDINSDLTYTEAFTGIKMTGSELIEYLVRKRREHISKGGIVGSVDFELKINNSKAQPQCPS